MTEDRRKNSRAKLKARDEESRIVSITEAAKINKVTRQAIYVAIKLGKLKATKVQSRWSINTQDLDDYRQHKYSRTKSTYNGQLLFDNDKGYFSVNQVAEMLNVPAQKIYYATRVGLLKAHRRGAAWVIHREDVEAYRKSYLSRKPRKRQAS